MWCSPRSTLLFAALIASSWTAPSPLSLSANTVTTLSGLQPNSGHDGILIHVLRTEDLIADQIKSKPLLLEKLSHLLIRVELGNQTLAVNGHSLPILPGPHRTLEVNVRLQQVQMLKMPKDSPLIPLGLTPPELLNIADKYMSEGLIAALLTVNQEPIEVEAMRGDFTPVQAEAFKVSIGIKILELDGMSLAETDIAPVQLLHLIVHPDPVDPSKVATLTTLAPESLMNSGATQSTRSNPGPLPADPIKSAIGNTLASVESTMQMLHDAVQGAAARASSLMNSALRRKPCHKRPHHHARPAPVPSTSVKPVAMATTVDPSHASPAQPVGRYSTVDSFRRKMGCFVKMVTRSSLVLLLLGLPLALIFLVIASTFGSFLRGSMHSDSNQVPPAYEAVMVEEKVSDDNVVVLMPPAHPGKN